MRACACRYFPVQYNISHSIQWEYIYCISTFYHPAYHAGLHYIDIHKFRHPTYRAAKMHRSCRSLSAKEPLIIGLFCGKWPVKIRHPTHLRHPVPHVILLVCSIWIIAKEPLIVGLFCGKQPMKIKHPTHLRHPILCVIPFICSIWIITPYISHGSSLFRCI